MNTLICAGGSGLRVLESTLHLCAAGLGPKDLRILAIDPDAANGNGNRVKDLLDCYLRCQNGIAGQLGDVPWFNTKLDLVGTGDKLTVWSPVQSDDTLRKILNYDVLETTETPPDTANLFFTDAELDLPLGGGFRGHPAIGAAAMALVSLHARKQPWAELIQKIKGDVGQPAGSRVFIAGSVFGGTGASAIHPIARFVKSIPETNPDRLKVGVCALVPYFSFASTDSRNIERAGTETSGPIAKAEYFSLSTRSAVEFYDYLRKNMDWPFDAVYWLGDSGLMNVDWAPYGPRQQNPSHFVDLLGTLACLEFFQSPVSGMECYYTGPRAHITPPPPHQNLVDWPDLPLRTFSRDELKNRMLQFFLVGAMHLGFCEPLLRRKDLDARAYCVPWYYERFAKRQESLATSENQQKLTVVSEYFREYYFNWCVQMLQKDSVSVRLFNVAALRGVEPRGAEADLHRLSNFLWPDRPGEASLDSVDRFFTDMVRVDKNKGGTSGVGAYVSLLAHAADAFIKREYQNVEVGNA